MYNKLAKYYEALVYDEDAYDLWVNLILKYKSNGRYLDMGCGTGIIANKLVTNFSDIDAFDISKEMIELAKNRNSNINFFIDDITTYNSNNYYDCITSLCDTLNYIIDIDDIKKVFINVYNMLNNNGVFIFDIHSLDRLEEFSEDYIEEGIELDTLYIWNIYSKEDYLYQNFSFFEEEQVCESYIQKVYDPNILLDILNNIGFKVEIKTDFINEGITTGEKYFFICKKEN